MAPRVVLIGSPGAGKTTVGQLLAESLGVGFRDTDADVERVAGRTIPDIFVVDGEPFFRALERQAVAAALDEHDGVLALGGGAVLAPETQQLLRGQPVIWLRVSAANAAGRVGVSGPRPLLIGTPHATLVKLLNERAPIYEAVASVTVDTDYVEPTEVAARVREWLDAQQASIEETS